MAAERDGQASEVDVISFLQSEVDALYRLKERYFEDHSLDQAGQKEDEIKKRLAVAMEHFDRLKNSVQSKERSRYHYLRGRSLNVVCVYNPEAESLLSKAVKLDPRMIEAWNELGECFYQKGDLQGAMRCFKSAIDQGGTKESYRNLSIVLRQLPTENQVQRKKNLLDGVSTAKQAVEVDPLDGTSWGVLGNAHLSLYFSYSQHPNTLKLCLSAYAQAEKDPISRNTSELSYNKGVALRYAEEHQSALASFEQSLALDPNWEDPRKQRDDLVRYLDKVNKLSAQSGQVKARQLRQMVETMSNQKEKSLGPLAAKVKAGERSVVGLNDLQNGLNTGKVILGSVVCSVQTEGTVPFTFCMIDEMKTCVAVTVYNLAAGKGVIIGDCVAIPDPFLSEVRVTYKDQVYEFRSIRVELPTVMVVNGKKWGPEMQTLMELTTFDRDN